MPCRFGMTDAGEEFYRHAVAMLREAEQAETAIRHRLNEPTGTVRCTAAVATMQFAMRDIVPDFLVSGFVSLVRAFEPSLVGFFDIGNTWYEKQPTNFTEPVETRAISEVSWLKSFGVELRAGQEAIFLIGAGVGWEIREGSSPPDWYFRISSTF